MVGLGAAFRSVQDKLGLDEVFVLGTNCADNSPTPKAAQEFLREGLKVDETKVQGYEFMQVRYMMSIHLVIHISDTIIHCKLNLTLIMLFLSSLFSFFRTFGYMLKWKKIHQMTTLKNPTSASRVKWQKVPLQNLV